MMRILSVFGKGMLTCLGIFILTSAYSQTFTPRPGVKIAYKSNGYYEYLPEGYNESKNSSKTYPLIVFCHGIGENGNGSSDLSRVLANGTPKTINQGLFPKSFSLNGQSYSFIVIVPQFWAWADPSDISSIIDFAETNYRVDKDRIYITGLSMGGGIVVDYAGASAENSSRIAAMVPVCEAATGNDVKYENMAKSNLPVWATHNEDDGTVSVWKTKNLVDGINSYEIPPDPKAKMTLWPTGGHDAWSRTYDLKFKEDGKNIYEWMLTYSRSSKGILEVSDLKFNAKEDNGSVALTWSTSKESNNQGFTVERSADGKQFDSLTFISGLGNEGGNYSYNDYAPLNGKSFYRVKAISTTGQITYSNIKTVETYGSNLIGVYPNPVAEVLNINSNYVIDKGFLRVFDMNGRAVMEKIITGSGNHSIPVNLPSGMYSAVLVENGQTTFKTSFIKR